MTKLAYDYNGDDDRSARCLCKSGDNGDTMVKITGEEVIPQRFFE
jgi:hypothetical protein